MNSFNVHNRNAFKQGGLSKGITNRWIATIILVSMCIQYMPIEGVGVSYVKVAIMAITPLIWLKCVPVLRRPAVWSFLYFGVVFISAVLWNNNYRSSTLIYLFLFMLTFNVYYNLIYRGVFSIEKFQSILKFIILAYTLVLILQQLAILAGFRQFFIINFLSYIGRGIGSNSLALEPSHSARVMGVAFYAYLKVNEIRLGRPISLKKILNDDRWVFAGFLYSMVTMGSGTAFVTLLIICLYFLQKKYMGLVISAVIIIFTILPYIDYDPLNRATTAMTSVFESDSSTVIGNDGSAAVRILPILNTFRNMELNTMDTWFGKGSDVSNELGVFSEKRMIGTINDYGLLSFLLGVVLIFSSCLTSFFSVGTLLVFFLLSFTVNNFAYAWGIYMLLVPVKYFYSRKKTFKSNLYE